MRITLPVAALVTLFSALGVLLGPSLASSAEHDTPTAPAPVACVLPSAAKVSMPLIPPRLGVIR